MKLMALKLVGKVMDAHGIRGDIYCLIFSGDSSWCDQLETIHLKLSDRDEAFEIAKIKPFKKGFIASLKGFNDRNKAEAYKGAELWVDESIFISDDGEPLYLNEILNFSLYDKNLGHIGEISGFSSNGIQDLLVVKSNSHTYEIPFVKEYVLDIEFGAKKMSVDLPEGLLEINNDEN
jgi:16S rRNA processing protein RimM